MQLRAWTEDLIGSTSKIRILRFLLADPSKTRTEREIARAVDMSTSSVNAAIDSLRRAGALEFRRVGRTHAIRVRSGLYPMRGLDKLFAAERRTLRELRRVAGATLSPGVACYLYGSAARGTDRPDSDVDVLVVAGTRREAQRAAAALSERLAQTLPLRLEILVLDRRDLATRRRRALARRALSEGIPLTDVSLEEFL